MYLESLLQLVHPGQLVLLYLSTLLDSWLAHCDILESFAGAAVAWEDGILVFLWGGDGDLGPNAIVV